MAQLEFDAIVIGSGQGGNPLAMQLAGRGERVAVIERGVLGGTCVNTGCTPTKMYVASAQVAYYGREAKRWGVQAGEVQVDLAAVKRRAQDYVEKSRHSWERKFAGQQNLQLIRGVANFVGKRTVAVNGDVLTAAKIFIDTGASSTIPDLPGMADSGYLTNETLLQLEELPAHLLVLGGGYIGLEFAQIFRRFGCQVTVISDGAHILPHEDEDVSVALQEALAKEGIAFALHQTAQRIERSGATVRLTTSNGNSFSGSHLLVAVGRTPNTRDLTLDKAGIETDGAGHIKVNDQLETSAEGVWALGDVKGGPAFTHISYNDYQIVYGNLYEGKRMLVSERLVPYAAYTDPELGRVGLTEREARAAYQKQGKQIKVGQVPMSYVARALERGEAAGLMKIVVDGETDQLLGAAILSSEGGETVQILSTLMLAKQPYTLLKGTIYIHPTMAEGLFSLMDSVA